MAKCFGVIVGVVIRRVVEVIPGAVDEQAVVDGVVLALRHIGVERDVIDVDAQLGVSFVESDHGVDLLLFLRAGLHRRGRFDHFGIRREDAGVVHRLLGKRIDIGLEQHGVVQFDKPVALLDGVYAQALIDAHTRGRAGQIGERGAFQIDLRRRGRGGLGRRFGSLRQGIDA